MRKVFKWVGIILAVILGLGIVAISYIYIVTEARLNKIYAVQVESIELPADISTVERGYPQVILSVCRDCHGQNYAGQVMEDDPMTARLVAPNLTRGKGGVGGRFTVQDWVRVLRHGVDEDGTSLIVMPADIFAHLSDTDLGYVIAYLQSVPPVDNELPEIRLGPMGRFFVLQQPIFAAELIDHDAPRPPDPERGVSVEYGRYLTSLCVSCHGEDFAGGEQVGAGLNLTPGGDLANWTEADFIRAMRTGKRPDNRDLDQEMMPVRITGQFSDDELKAIWLFLQSLPPLESKLMPES
ncbi:MAG TPA: c-type cytochrome [Anaerolineales bacterium]|nr:c-type cytochrome [Anaerolineales bacterium]